MESDGPDNEMHACMTQRKPRLLGVPDSFTRRPRDGCAQAPPDAFPLSCTLPVPTPTTTLRDFDESDGVVRMEAEVQKT